MAQGSVGAAVLLGNIVSFAADDGPRLLAEVARVLRPGGILVADFASPAASLREFFYRAAQGRLLRDVLRRPGRYFIPEVLETGVQPCAPDRLAAWEFRFYTVDRATAALEKAGFAADDVMTVAPLSYVVDPVATLSRRDPVAWENLLRLEEAVGRRPGVAESGHGFLVAAHRRIPRAGAPRRRGSGSDAGTEPRDEPNF